MTSGKKRERGLVGTVVVVVVDRTVVVGLYCSWFNGSVVLWIPPLTELTQQQQNKP